MKAPLTHISVSSITDFQNDRLRWVYKWLENRVPRSVPQALITGKIVHKSFENGFNNNTGPSVELAKLLVPFEGSILMDREQKSYDELKGMVEPLSFWKDQFPITRTLEVEEPFEYPLPNGLIFQGRPDRVVEVFGKVMHVQNKTIGAARDIGQFITLARRNLHELLYGEYLSRKYPTMPYGGTIYNIIRKLKYRGKTVTKAEPLGKILNTPESMFMQTVIGLDEKAMEQARADLHSIATDMLETTMKYYHGVTIPSNRSLDGGIYGNHIDPYTLVMMGEASLEDDSLFMDREQTYAVAEEASE